MSKLKEDIKSKVKVIQVSQKTILKRHKWGRDKDKDNGMLDSYHESLKLITKINQEIKKENENQIEFLEFKIKNNFENFSKYFV
jgi:tRNA splicing endonuclease